jgi:hypothetical protein
MGEAAWGEAAWGEAAWGEAAWIFAAGLLPAGAAAGRCRGNGTDFGDGWACAPALRTPMAATVIITRKPGTFSPGAARKL